MATIGYVTKKQDRFQGTLKTLNVNQPISIIPNTAKAHANQPDYLVYSRGVSFGAGWTKRGKVSGNLYISLRLVAPTLGQRVYANLGRVPGDNEDAYAIIWNPPQ